MAWVLAACLSLFPRQDTDDLLSKAKFRQAWAQTGTMAPLPQARARATILLRAGDPREARSVVEQGLALFPEDLELLFHETTAAIWLRNGAAASEAVQALRSALDKTNLEDTSREEWSTIVQRKAAEATILQDRQTSLNRAITASAVIASLTTAGAIAAVLAAVRLSWSHGKSSSPVS